jgi:hypothetical protein
MAGILEQLSRRNMLVGLGGATAAGAAVAVQGGTASFAQALGLTGAGGSTGDLKNAGYDGWAAQIGSNFSVDTGNVLKLVDVHKSAPQGTRPRSLRPDSFIASFDISRGGELAEGLYRVAHSQGGTFDIFLTKGASNSLRMLAVFN